MNCEGGVRLLFETFCELGAHFRETRLAELRLIRLLRTSPNLPSREFRTAPALCGGASYVEYGGA
jgi:hypothetical protein